METDQQEAPNTDQSAIAALSLGAAFDGLRCVIPDIIWGHVRQAYRLAGLSQLLPEALEDIRPRTLSWRLPMADRFSGHHTATSIPRSVERLLDPEAMAHDCISSINDVEDLLSSVKEALSCKIEVAGNYYNYGRPNDLIVVPIDDVPEWFALRHSHDFRNRLTFSFEAYILLREFLANLSGSVRRASIDARATSLRKVVHIHRVQQAAFGSKDYDLVINVLGKIASRSSDQ